MTNDPEHPGGKGERPAAPQQPDSGFEEGLEQRPESPAEEPEPDFARGQDADHDEETAPRFSRGEERDPESPENATERRFSEGQERGPRRD